MNPCRKNKISGFTLIEVLVAIAILSIALTAIIKASAQNIRNTQYLQEKNIASWVGLEVINEARAGVLKLQGDKKEMEQTVLGIKWLIKAYATPTPNPHIQQLHVDVLRKRDEVKIMSLVSYRYVTQP